MKGMFWHPVLLIRGKYPDIQYQFGGIVCKMLSKDLLFIGDTSFG